MYSLICESVLLLFLETFGDEPPPKLRRSQITGILQNVHLAQSNREKAKKILCWSSSKGYIKFLHDIAARSTLSCLNGVLNLRSSQVSHSMTPLYLAARQQHVEIVEFLISSPNARINELCGSYSHTISHIAASKGSLAILRVIGRHSVNAVNPVRDRSRPRLRWDIDKKDGVNLCSPLMTAIIHGHTHCVGYLIECGADVNFVDKHEMTCLYIAAENGHVAICEMLLNYGARIDAKSKAGKSPLFVACDQGFVDVVALLIGYGANVRLKSSRGKLPLYVAAEKGFKDIVKVLLDHSEVSDLFTMTSYGTTPFFIASKQLDKGVKLLFKRFCVKQQQLKRNGTKMKRNSNGNARNPPQRRQMIMSEHADILQLSSSDLISEESVSLSQSSVQRALQESQQWLRKREQDRSAGPVMARQRRVIGTVNTAAAVSATIAIGSLSAAANVTATTSVTSTQELFTERLPTPLFAHEMEDFQDAQSSRAQKYNFSRHNAPKKPHRYYRLSSSRPKVNGKKRLWR